MSNLVSLSSVEHADLSEFWQSKQVSMSTQAENDQNHLQEMAQLFLVRWILWLGLLVLAGTIPVPVHFNLLIPLRIVVLCAGGALVAVCQLIQKGDDLAQVALNQIDCHRTCWAVRLVVPMKAMDETVNCECLLLWSPGCWKRAYKRTKLLKHRLRTTQLHVLYGLEVFSPTLVPNRSRSEGSLPYGKHVRQLRNNAGSELCPPWPRWHL